MNKSIIPPTGDFGANWPGNPNLPQGKKGLISAAGWTYENEGFVQQTFLGASVRNFNSVAGFGNSSSSLTISLIEDEFNQSDKTGLGIGDDVYHNGIKDKFSPPPVGAPVFFKFGKNFATIEQAWRPYFDELYNVTTFNHFSSELNSVEYASFPIPIPENNYLDLNKSHITTGSGNYVFVDKSSLGGRKDYLGDKDTDSGSALTIGWAGRGFEHFIFGGILQSFSQNGSVGGSPLYSVEVIDPREILSNVSVILNGYAGSIFNNKNYINVFGFLEYDVSHTLKDVFEKSALPGYIKTGIEKIENWISDDRSKQINTIEKTSSDQGIDESLEKSQLQYRGTDMFFFKGESYDIQDEESSSPLPMFFPMTGEGFSRRCSQGIPFYRVRQAIEALFETKGKLPKEYRDAGFGGPINFRGYNYIVDFSGIPLEKIPEMFFLDFDQINLFDLAQEVCDIISHDLYVTLLPVISHPACYEIWKKNKELSQKVNNSEEGKRALSEIIVGIIRIEAIDRSKPPELNKIKTYIDNLSSIGINVEDKDLGYELANITTDKIVAGGQTVDMYFFSNFKDRDNLQVLKKSAGEANFAEKLFEEQWLLETSLKQEILPFYGFLGKNAVTIPIGFGSYQQILLDSTGLDANGVGNYYVATEMELRAALISYEQWSRFLLQYNETYIEEIGENQIFWKSLASTIPSGTIPETFNPEKLYNREFGVSVPRCVFNSEKPFMGKDGYPASPCSPPIGYPLYYKRAEKIGIPEAGIASFQNSIVECVTNYEKLKKKKSERDESIVATRQNIDQQIKNTIKNFSNYVGNIFDPGQGSFSALIQGVGEAINMISKFQTEELLDDEITLIRNTVMQNKALIKSMNLLSRQHAKNARKVYDFVRNIAEKHLGKTFLVRIPKRCNPFFNKNIVHIDDQNRTGLNYFSPSGGPYGFRPVPIYSGVDSADKLSEDLKDYKKFVEDENSKNPFDVTINNFDYLPTGFLDTFFDKQMYTLGALKNNFNPISDQWEFNYIPNPQGGFFSYDLYDVNMVLFTTDSGKLSLVQKQLLAPIDLSNFENNGRISAYVRFDNSEYLDFSSIPRDSFYQQIASGNKYVPDIMEELDNINPDRRYSFDQISRRIESGSEEAYKKKAVTFVRCEVDETFYMTPKIVSGEFEVFGRNFIWKPNIQPLAMIEKENVSGCIELVPTMPYALPIFSLAESGGVDGTKGIFFDFNRGKFEQFPDANIIKTSKLDLDNDHVYALITLPGRIIPTVDQRYMDGPYQAINGQNLKHLLTQDTVKMPEGKGFDKPGTAIRGSGQPLNCDEFTFKQLTDAQKSQKEVVSKIGFANPEVTIGFQHPSPVFPNLVALPLTSTERCYGPWISSSIFNNILNSGDRYSNIGGKVEFIKTEELSPWNYGGYKLMNDAGALQAQFSNSLMLFSERGGFTYTDFPINIRMGRALNGLGLGPLVTSVSIDISDSIRTTIRMDLYTSRFGKLSKQKEDAIAQINRERQKIRDEKNYLARRGFAKSVSSNDILSDIRKQMSMFRDLATQSSDFYTSLEKGQYNPSLIVASIDRYTQEHGPGLSETKEVVNSTNTNPNEISEKVSLMTNDGGTNSLNAQFQRTAAMTYGQMFTPYSSSPSPYLPAAPQIPGFKLEERIG